MPPRVQDVRSTSCDDQYGYGFNIWDQKGKLALTIGFATNEEAQKACEEIKAIVARALFVTSPT